MEHELNANDSETYSKKRRSLLQSNDSSKCRIPSEPIPLYQKLEPALPYPIDAMGEILGNGVKSLHRIIKAPDAICAQSVLGAAALVCQPFANFAIDDRQYPLSLNLLTVAKSGDSKSSTDKIAILPISERQERLIKHYGQLLKEIKTCRLGCSKK
jgi:hypothetical protein